MPGINHIADASKMVYKRLPKWDHMENIPLQPQSLATSAAQPPLLAPPAACILSGWLTYAGSNQ